MKLLCRNQIVYDYLVQNLHFPKLKALWCSNSTLSKLSTLENPQAVVNYFKSIGFTDAQIIDSAIMSPSILSKNVHRTLKPKIQFFQDLGFSGSNLGKFISCNSSLLDSSLNNKLKPTLEITKNILSQLNVQNVDAVLLRFINRSSSVIHMDTRLLLANVEYLESCGVVGSQLARLLMYNPRLFFGSQAYLKSHVSRALDLGFTFDSRMFMRGLMAISGIGDDNFQKKLKLFKSFGLTGVESGKMIKSSPNILMLSEDTLRSRLGFYLETVGLEKSELIPNGVCLALDMKRRVVPRYRLVNLVKSKGILQKEIRLTSCFKISDEKFLKKYVTKFPDHAKDLWDAYMGYLTDSWE